MTEILAYIAYVYSVLAQWVADNTALAIVIGVTFLAVCSVDEIRTHRRNRAQRDA